MSHADGRPSGVRIVADHHGTKTDGARLPLMHPVSLDLFHEAEADYQIATGRTWRVEADHQTVTARRGRRAT